MKSILLVAALVAAPLSALQAQAVCEPGAYRRADGDFVVVTQSRNASPGQRYLFRDGRRGSTADANSPVVCAGHATLVRTASGASETWARLDLVVTPVAFTSDATTLTGALVEPAGPPDSRRPLVVLVHGSEKTPAIGGQLSFVFAAQAISVFAYDKRGTGASAGEYTQNFELLADDAAAALGTARTMAAGRFGRAGFYGGSQGGWVAPLAATHSPADFVAVGFGLVASPIDEDREQMESEVRAAGLGAPALAQVDRLSRVTARLVSSHFLEGYDDLARVRRELQSAPWAATVEGEYSGEMLRMSDADLRRIGRARFDNLELIWDYDATAALKKVKTPLLWVLAGEDREAPIGETRNTLLGLIKAGDPVDLYLFPNTDHGMLEYTVNPDGSRTMTRVTEGYYRLLGDWMKGSTTGRYGRALRLGQSE